MLPEKKVFFNGLELVVFSSVYEPLEDSFLLANALPELNRAVVLDLGCGCGLQGIAAALKGAQRVVCADQNPVALENARENAQKAGLAEKFSFVQSDLFSGFSGKEKFDCIVFNPPYVPSENELKWIETDGGEKGRQVLDRFLDAFSSFLAEKGVVFFLQSSQNGVRETERRLEKQGFRCAILVREKLFFEELVVFRVWR